MIFSMKGIPCRHCMGRLWNWERINVTARCLPTSSTAGRNRSVRILLGSNCRTALCSVTVWISRARGATCPPFTQSRSRNKMLAIIGGRGLTQLANLAITHQQVMRTPYGEPSGAFLFGTLNEHEAVSYTHLTLPTNREV